MNPSPARFRWLALLTLSLALGAVTAVGAESGAPTGAPPRADETNSQEALRAYLQLQEQIHTAQQAIEQNRKETKEAAAQSAEVLAGRLRAIEEALGSQRARELEALQNQMQSSNRVMLIAAGTFAGLGVIALLLMAYFQWRTVNGLAEISTVIPQSHPLGPGSVVAALGPGEAQLASGVAAASNARLLGALEQLEKRIYELEHTARPPLHEALLTAGTAPPPHGSANGNGEPALAPAASPANATEPAPGTGTPRITMLLGKGQSMLNLDNARAALECFEEVLSLEPEHPEALVKKGTALERLQQLDEAITCYDRAIANDPSLTVAYLHKAGLFNRLERFNEALACYEQALRTQEKRPE